MPINFGTTVCKQKSWGNAAHDGSVIHNLFTLQCTCIAHCAIFLFKYTVLKAIVNLDILPGGKIGWA